MCGIWACLDLQCRSKSGVVSKERHNQTEASSTWRLLASRGPDHISRIDILDGRVSFVAAVLHLRGTQLCPQPHVHAETGNILLWNGECFAGSPDVSLDENDTEKLLSFLCGHELAKGEDVARAFSGIHGPYAFIFYLAHQRTLYFGRDPLGRRSLLAQQDLTSGRISISSVAPFGNNSLENIIIKDKEEKQAGEEDLKINSSLDAAASESPGSAGQQQKGSSSEWIELPVTGIFSLPCDQDLFCSEGPAGPPPAAGREEEEGRRGRASSPPSPLAAHLPAAHHHPWPPGTVGLAGAAAAAAGAAGESLGGEGGQRRGKAEQVVDVGAEASEELFLGVLREAVHRRVRSVPAPASSGAPPDGRAAAAAAVSGEGGGRRHLLQAARVGVLFSGGLDCTVLAALADGALPAGEPVDLINVCFEAGASPDRAASITSLKELQSIFPSRPWRLICVDVPYSEAIEHQDHIKGLMQPCNTHMDFNIGAAFWFASRAQGYIYSVSSQEEAEKHLQIRDIKNLEGRPLLRFGENNEHLPENHGKRKHTKTFEAGNSCSVERCKKKIKQGCAFQTCRSCCLKLQQQIDPQSLEFRSNHPLLLPWFELNKTWISDHYQECMEKNMVLCQPHKTKQGKKNKKTTRGNDFGDHETKLLQGKDDKMCGGNAEVQHSDKLASCGVPYCSKAKVLLIGIGADEQLGGYGRHRTAFRAGGEGALRRELAADVARLWTRNLGRDDRCVSDHGREARFPFLDEGVVAAVRALPLRRIVDLSLPPGIGDKKILRDVAKTLGLQTSSLLVKRAIQFGSRIAKHSNIQAFGSNRKGKGDIRFVGKQHEDKK